MDQGLLLPIAEQWLGDILLDHEFQPTLSDAQSAAHDGPGAEPLGEDLSALRKMSLFNDMGASVGLAQMLLRLVLMA